MKKNCLKRLPALLLALIMALSLFAMPAMAAEGDGPVIKLHYNRPDGNYDDWSVWFWDLGKEGVDIPFAEENGEMVATYPVKAGVTSVGFIVKLPNWAAKDVNEDQFIDVAAYVSGTVHVYVESGVKGYETVLGDDIVSGIKVKSAVYKEGSGIQVTMTAAVDPSALSVNGPDGPVAIEKVSGGGANLTLVPQQELDLRGTYTLNYAGEEYPIQMPNIYSTESFEAAYTYTGDDLGAVWTPEKTAFRVWAPTADSVTLRLYAAGDPAGNDLLEQIPMTADVNGTWVAEKTGDLNGTYYTYLVCVDGATNEVCDPYARTTGVNGQRAMVIDLDSTDPEGWETDSDPNGGNPITDAVIYELHIRDLSMDESSGIVNKGKFLGLTESGTVNSAGQPTGLDHIKSLGITHLHLLPVYDYASVDERDPSFNWGYDPQNYNVPEGSYSTDPYRGEVRVAEMKQMVKTLHDNGISVVMDVVYNHVYNAGTFCINQIVPGYFSRISDSGAYSNGSGCGNDTASERSMVRKYIVDSVKYWADEYHIDGFRFDLVGLLDVDTVNAIVEEVHKTHPNVIFYGEGWTLTTSVTKEDVTLATQLNSELTPGFAYFSDDIRDALKGNVFDNNAVGYVSGASGYEAKIVRGFTGAPKWCVSPTQTVNYASCHDNMTLFDRLTQSASDATRDELIRMNNLAAAIYMTSQGVPFIHAGEEMLRTKPLPGGGFDHNSYASSDEVNCLKWDDLNGAEYQSVLAYYQGLIAFRKAHPALRMTSAEEVAAHVTSVSGLDSKVTAFHITAGAGGEEHDLYFIFNPRAESTSVTLPNGQWDVYVAGDRAGTEVLDTVKGTVEVEAISAMVLVKSGESDPLPQPTESQQPADPEPAPANGSPAGFIIGAAVVVAAAAAVAVVLLKKRRK